MADEGGKQKRIVGGQPEFACEAHGFGMRKFGERVLHPGDPVGVQFQRRKVRLGEVSVIVRLFLAPHGKSAPFGFVPEARFLDDPAAFGNDPHLSFDFIVQSFLQKAKRIQVLYFNLSAECVRPFWPDRHVGIAPKAAFLHVAVADAQIQQSPAQVGHIVVGFLTAAKVRLADDFDQRDPAAIEVHVGLAVGIGHPVMNGLAGILLEVESRDSERLLGAVNDVTALRPHPSEHRNTAIFRQWTVEL